MNKKRASGSHQRKVNNSSFGLLISLIGAILFSAGCAAPFSDFQSARTLGKGGLEVTPHYSKVRWYNDNSSDNAQTNLGLQVGVGLGSAADFRFRYERITVDNEDGFNSNDQGFNVLAFGPKFGIIPDAVALSIPFGFAFGEDVEISKTWEAHPTLIVSATPNNHIQFNGSAKMLIQLNSDETDPLVAFNFSPAFSSNLQKWALRPEIGFLFNPGDEGHFKHFSLGFTVYK